MLPSLKQYSSWSLPSKLTALGTAFGLVSIVISVIFFLLSYGNGQFTMTSVSECSANVADVEDSSVNISIDCSEISNLKNPVKRRIDASTLKLFGKQKTLTAATTIFGSPNENSKFETEWNSAKLQKVGFNFVEGNVFKLIDTDTDQFEISSLKIELDDPLAVSGYPISEFIRAAFDSDWTPLFANEPSTNNQTIRFGTTNAADLFRQLGYSCKLNFYGANFIRTMQSRVVLEDCWFGESQGNLTYAFEAICLDCDDYNYAIAQGLGLNTLDLHELPKCTLDQHGSIACIESFSKKTIHIQQGTASEKAFWEFLKPYKLNKFGMGHLAETFAY